MDVLKLIEESQLKKDIPAFAPGDRVKVHYKVVEGGRERIQAFDGVVMPGSGRRERDLLSGASHTA